MVYYRASLFSPSRRKKPGRRVTTMKVSLPRTPDRQIGA